MTISTLTQVAKENGTIGMTVKFYDEDGVLVIPTAATWTLKDSSGAIVNSRSAVVISPLADTVYVTLSGSDLPVSGHELEELTFTVNATYNSLTFGNGLTLVDQCKISVEAIE
jgi:hypothetical protein